MKTNKIILIGALAVAWVGAPMLPTVVLGQPEFIVPPELVLLNGKIATVDDHNSFVQAVAIRDGKIIATGFNGQMRGLAMHDTQVINLHGRTVLPGLIDGTLHAVRNGYHCFTQHVRLDTTVSREDALDAYAAKAAELGPGVWVFTRSGWNVNQLDVPGIFTRAELDGVMPDNPAFVIGTGAPTQANTLALQALGLDDAAHVDGVLTNSERNMINPLLGFTERSIDEQAACLSDFIREGNRRGLTAWDDPGGNDVFSPVGGLAVALVDNHGFQAVNQLWRDGELNARIVLHLTSFGGLETVLQDTRHAVSLLGDDMLRMGGPGEEIVAGSGRIMMGTPQFDDYVAAVTHMAVNRWNFQHHMTSLSSQAVLVTAWEMANAVALIDNLHWSVLHPDDMSVDILARLAALNASVVPTDGDAVSGGSHPYRRLIDSDANVCLGTDAMYAGAFPPFVNLWFVTSGDSFVPGVPGVEPNQLITRPEALRAATVNCGKVMGQEGRLGSLQPGWHADLIVLSDDYFTVPDDQVRHITSVLTIVDGRIAFSDGTLEIDDDDDSDSDD